MERRLFLKSIGKALILTPVVAAISTELLFGDPCIRPHGFDIHSGDIWLGDTDNDISYSEMIDRLKADPIDISYFENGGKP